jgi:type IV secretion system protein TrbF
MMTFSLKFVPRTPAGQAPATPSPYIDAQTVWLERYGSYIQQAFNWRLLAILESIALCAAVFGLIYIGSQSKYVPYVVAVDKIGLPIGVKIADHADTPDDRLVRAQLANWIETARAVTTDPEAEKQNIDRVYAMVAAQSEAKTYLDAWYSGGHSPFDEARAGTVDVHIAWLLPSTPQSWQVQWSETIRDAKGDAVSTEQWAATIGVAIAPPQDESTILKNPLGLYITSLSWVRKL